MESSVYPNLLPEPMTAAGDHAGPHSLHLGRVVRRRLAVGVLVFLLLAPTFVVLSVLKYQPYFVAEATVQVNSIRPRILYRTDDNSSNTSFSTFFNTQIATLKSTALLSRCMTDPVISSSHILEGAPDPLQALRDALEVSTIPGTQYLSIRVRDEKPQGLAQVVNTIVRTYMAYLDEADSISQNRKIQLLDAERRKLALDVETKTAALTQSRASMASDPDASAGMLVRDPLSVTHEALVDLRKNAASFKTKIESLQAAMKSPDIEVPSSMIDAALARDPELEPLVIMLAQLRREIVLAEAEAASPAVATVQARLNADPQVGALKQDIARRELHLARLAQGSQATSGDAKDGQDTDDTGILVEALSDVPEARWLATSAMDFRRELAMLGARGTTPTPTMVREHLDAQPRIRALKNEMTRTEVELAQKSETLHEGHHTIWYMKATLEGMRTNLAKAETELKDKVVEELKQDLQQREKDLRAQLHSIEAQLKPHCERALARTKAIIQALRARLTELEPELKARLVQEIKKDAVQRAKDLREQLASVEKQVKERREQARVKVVALLKNEAHGNMARQLRDLEGELAATSTSDKALRTMLTEQVGRRATGERKMAELKSLEDDLGRARQSLLGVEQRLHELEVEAGAPGFVTIASMATDPKLPEPYVGRRIKYSIVGVIGAAGLALLAMILLDRRDDRIRCPEDLRLVAGADLLGCVPHWGARARLGGPEHPLLLHPSANAPVLVAEEIRNLMVNILSPPDGRPVRTVLVTGAAPGDGKTTVAVNLAGCMAGLGKSVLLIDVSFRKPDVARLFALDNVPGLGDVLGNRATLSEVTQGTSLPGLRIVPAGSMPSDTVGVLGSAAMRDVLSALASHYDHILLDGPPVMLADARILASLVDGVVCSLSALTSRRGVAHDCLTTLRRLGARILGVVLVGVRAEHNGYAAMDAALRGYAQAEPAVPQLAAGEPSTSLGPGPEAATNASDAAPTEN